MSKALIALCLMLLLAVSARAGDAQPDAPPFTTANSLERWLAGNASPLDALPPYARALFLDALDFGPRGLRGFPLDVLPFELTGAELLDVQSLLLDEPRPHPGLEPDEAARLRAARADGRLPPPSEAVLAAYRDWRARMAPQAGDTLGTIDPLVADAVASPQVRGEDLRLLLRLAVDSAGLHRDAARVDAARSLHARLHAQGLATRADHRDLQGLLLRTGRLEDARQFMAGVPDAGLPAVPRIDTAHALPADAIRIWQVEGDGPTPVLREGALDLGTRIVVVSSPACGFSNAAALAIPADPELGPLFARHATWLAASDAVASAAALRDWNRRHPATPILIAADPAQWPMAFDSTPQFLVFRDGALVDRHDGWQRDGSSREALHAMLVRAGLLRSTRPAPPADDNAGMTSGNR